MAANSLATVIRDVKARISREARRNGIPFGWQARFYDHIIRNINEMNHIAGYIESNVANWDLDKLNTYDWETKTNHHEDRTPFRKNP